jgi:hypothetical protein
MRDIKTYLSKKDPKLQNIAQSLRTKMKKLVPNVTESVNPWGIPTFEANDPFAYFMVGKKHVTLGFHYGASLADPQNLLEGTGKNLRHVKLRTDEDLSKQGLRELIVAAARFKPAGRAIMRGSR